jgi:hypothetical protein
MQQVKLGRIASKRGGKWAGRTGQRPGIVVNYSAVCGGIAPPEQTMDKSKCMDWRADLSADEAEKNPGVLCVFQVFETKAGGKYAVKTCAAICSAFTRVVR